MCSAHWIALQNRFSLWPALGWMGRMLGYERNGFLYGWANSWITLNLYLPQDNRPLPDFVPKFLFCDFLGNSKL